MRAPSGVNATLDTHSVCSLIGWPMGWRVVASQSRTVSVGPAGRDTRAVGAEGDTRNGVGVAAHRLADGFASVDSQSQMVESWLPDAMRLPSGLNTTLDT